MPLTWILQNLGHTIKMLETGWLSGDHGLGRFFKLQIGSSSQFRFLRIVEVLERFIDFIQTCTISRTRALADPEYEELMEIPEKLPYPNPEFRLQLNCSLEHFLLRSNVNNPLNLFSKHVRYPLSLQNTKLASRDILRNEQFCFAPLNRLQHTDMSHY